MANKREGRDEPTEELSFEERMLRFQERQLAIQEAAVEVQRGQLKQTAPKSNTAVPKISVFNPRGEKDFPMAPLKCEVYIPWKMTPQTHSLDREELELMNLIEPGDFQLELNDGTNITVCIVGVRNQNTRELEKLTFQGQRDDTGVYGALFTNENKQTFPSLKKMLRDILSQGDKADEAEAIMTMAVEVRKIKAGELALSVGA